MIELRTPAEIEAMRPAGRFVAETLATLRDETKVGTNLLAIDRRAHELIRRAGAESCYIDYHPSFGASPFGKVICTSVNDAVLHGLPFDYALRDGDLVSLDFAVSIDGWVADSAVSFVVGTAARRGSRAHRHDRAGAGCRDRGRGRRQPHRRHLARDRRRSRTPTATRSTPTSAGTASAASCTATRTSRTTARPGAAIRCARASSWRSSPGSCATTDELVTDPDGWTLRSADGSRGAHSEHTVAMTEDGPIVLTDRSWLGVA